MSIFLDDASLFEPSGANRGIGLEFVKQLCALGASKISYIIATARNPAAATELNELAKQNENLTVLKLDVTNYASYEEFYGQLASIVGDKGLQLLINNAGEAPLVGIFSWHLKFLQTPLSRYSDREAVRGGYARRNAGKFRGERCDAVAA